MVVEGDETKHILSEKLFRDVHFQLAHFITNGFVKLKVFVKG